MALGRPRSWVNRGFLFCRAPAWYPSASAMPDETLLDWLVRRFPTAKPETLRQMVRDGRVTVNGATPRGVKGEIAAGDRVEVAERRPERVVRSNVAASSRRRSPFVIVYE